MKNNLVVTLMVLALISSVLIVAVPIMPTSASPTEIHVPTEYSTIQDAVDAAGTGDTIIVDAGTYDAFKVDTKTDLTIEANGTVIVAGVQVVTTNYGDRDAVIFVTNSTNIVLDGLTVGPNTGKTQAKDYGIIYESSTGTIRNCIVAPETYHDMASIAIGIWDSCDVDIESCTVKDYGRIGVFYFNDCTGGLYDSTIIGQVYSEEGEVCYGIEVEGAYNDDDPATASQITISGNQIYNNDNTFSPGPSWSSAGIMFNGWLGYFPQADCTVIIEDNYIHDNYYGIEVVASALSYAHNNDIYNNREYGVIEDPDYLGNNVTFNALNNWWGHSSGPSGVGPGSGDSVSDYVDFEPWLSWYQPQTETQIYINPAVVEKYAFAGIEGSTFEVQVEVENIIDLYGFEFNVTWNSNLMKLVGVEYTSQLNQIWSQWTAQKNKTGPSWYQLVALALAPAVGFNGKGTLAKLTFRVEYGPCYIEPDYQLQARIHFAVVKLSDSDAQHICAEVHDGKYIIYAVKPGLKLRPTAVTCRKMGETFTTEIKMIDGFKVSGFNITIKYNTTLLEVDDVQWGNLSYFLPGPYIVKQFVRDDLNGLIQFHIVENVSDGAPLAYGDGILAAITFNVIKTKVWKSCPGWTNYIQDSITFKDWNITVMCPETYHLTGELVYIIDADYQFLSIKGDIDSNGIVDIFDITAVAAYYNIEKGDLDYISDFDLNCDDIIDIYDLVLIGGNFGYEYDP